MDFSDPRQMLFEIGFNSLGQHGHPVFPAFAVSDDDLIECKIDIFCPKTQTFEQTHSRTEKQRRDQLMCSTHDLQNSLPSSLTGPTDGAAPVRPLDIAELAERFLQHSMIKKYQRVKRLLLCVGGDFFPHCQMRRIKPHFQCAHVRGCFLS